MFGRLFVSLLLTTCRAAPDRAGADSNGLDSSVAEMYRSKGKTVLGVHIASDSVKSGGVNSRNILKKIRTKKKPAKSIAYSNGVNKKTGPGVADIRSCSGKNLPGPNGVTVTSLRDSGLSANNASLDTSCCTDPNPRQIEDSELYIEWKIFKDNTEGLAYIIDNIFVRHMAKNLNLPISEVQAKIQRFEKEDSLRNRNVDENVAAGNSDCDNSRLSSLMMLRELRPYFTDLEIEQVRNIVLEMYGVCKRWPAVSDVINAIRLNVNVMRCESQSGIIEALCLTRDFLFGTPFPGSREMYVSEPFLVSMTRLHFLEKMSELRNNFPSLPIVYVAETWLDWDETGDMLRHPGQHSMLSAMTKTPAARLGRMIAISAASSISGPLHWACQGRGILPGDQEPLDQLQENFKNWFVRLCENLTEPSVIAVDTSLHHWVKIQSPHQEVPEYVINKIALDSGHRMVRMPERHNRYNPMEQLLTEAKWRALCGGAGNCSEMFKRLCNALDKLCQPSKLWLNRMKSTQKAYEKDLAERRRLNSLVEPPQEK